MEPAPAVAQFWGGEIIYGNRTHGSLLARRCFKPSDNPANCLRGIDRAREMEYLITDNFLLLA